MIDQLWHDDPARAFWRDWCAQMEQVQYQCNVRYKNECVRKMRGALYRFSRLQIRNPVSTTN
jgi:hypothetical protein